MVSFVRKSVSFEIMLIDVTVPEKWDELNDQIKSSLGLSDRLRARAYYGLAQAVFEVSQSTAQFMSHKRAVGFIFGQTAVMESLLPYYYKETYEVQTLSHAKLQNIQEWVESLKKDTNFVLFSEDHPVTGELYPFADELDKLLNEKRIYSFRTSHFQHLHQNVEVRPYTVRLCSFSPTSAVAILGERFRSPALMVQNMVWEKFRFLEELAKARSERVVNPGLVEKFEEEIKTVGRPYFSPKSSRLFDRAVCIFDDVSAEALAEILFAKLGYSSEDGWKKISTTNLCHWSVVKMFRHWWEPQPTAEDLRGLLVIGAELLNTKDFAKLVVSSYEELKAQQSFSL